MICIDEEKIVYFLIYMDIFLAVVLIVYVCLGFAGAAIGSLFLGEDK